MPIQTDLLKPGSGGFYTFLLQVFLQNYLPSVAIFL